MDGTALRTKSAVIRYSASKRILSTANNLVIGLILRAGHENAAKARRHDDGHIAEAFGLLLTAKFLLEKAIDRDTKDLDK